MSTQTSPEPTTPTTGESRPTVSKAARPPLVAGLFILGVIVVTVGLTWFLFSRPKSVKVEVPATAEKKETSVSVSGIAMNTDRAAIRTTVDDLYKEAPGAGTPKVNATVPNQPPGATKPENQAPPAETIAPVAGPPAGPTGPTGGQSAPPPQSPEPRPVSLTGERSVRFGLPRGKEEPSPQAPARPAGDVGATPRRAAPAAPQTGIVSRVNGLKAVRPPFNTVLPFRLQGTVSTLFPGSTVRMEVTRECRGADWTIPAGTILVGQVQTSRRDRIQIVPIGYLDDRTQTLIPLTGEIRDGEGEIGIRGTIQREQGLLQRAAARAFNVSVSLFQSFLQSRGRGTNVVVPAVTGTAQDATGLAGLQRLSNSDYVIVKAGTEGTLLVTELPEGSQARVGRFSNSEPEVPASGQVLSDDEALEILRRGNREEISRAMPRMSETIQLVAQELLKELP